MTKGQLVIVDDHILYREGLKMLLMIRGGFGIVGEGADGQIAVNLAKTLKPDVIVMSANLPLLNGVESTRRITAEQSQVKVIGLAKRDDEHLATRMIEAGASGFLAKDCSFDELAHAIETVLKGETYLSDSTTTEFVRDHMDKKTAGGEKPLSAREREVLQLITEGKTTKETASLLLLSEKTIESHRKHIMDKLGIHSIAKLTKYAIREGFTTLDD